MDYRALGDDQYIASNAFHAHWLRKKVHIYCDNEAVITVLCSGTMHDAFLAGNIWYTTAIHDIDAQFSHIKGVDNTVADLLSRWQGSPQQVQLLHSHIKNQNGLQFLKIC